MIPDISRVAALMRDVAYSEVLPKFRNLSTDEISEKASGELVTIADQRAENKLMNGLQILFPGNQVIGEELAERQPAVLNKLNDEGPLWIIDPIDGTHNFADGKTRFAMIIAFVQNGKTLAGLILEPYTNRLVSGVSGGGAWEDGAALRIPNQKDIRKFHGSLNKNLRERLLTLNETEAIKIPKEMTRYACVGAEYADLARGKLQFARYIGNLKPWDHAAGILIHKEAGGFSAYVDTCEPYYPEPPHCRGAIMVAPREESWYELRELTSL